MSSDASGGSRFPTKVVIATATGAVVAAGAAYYVYSKSACAGAPQPKSKEPTFDDLKRLKEEGNTHFVQKRYAEGMDCFSQVIDECLKTRKHDKNVNSNKEEAAEFADLLAVCYQNRAAARQASEDEPIEVIRDCSHAIGLKPLYGKAYIRRAHLLKSMEPKQALADALAAMHIDEKFGEQMMGMMGDLMTALEKRNMEDFQARKDGNAVKKTQLIMQDQIFTYLYKTLDDEYIRNLFFKKVASSSESLNEAFESIKKHKFEGALAILEKSDEPECSLLAARLAYYQGNPEKFEAILAKFEQFVSSAPEDFAHLDDLKISYALLRIETADSIVSLLQLFEAAASSHGPRADFFASAAFRCTFYDGWEQALTILTDSRFKHSKLSQVLCFFVQINAILLRGENPTDAYKIIAKLEEFVDALDDKDEHKNWSVFALSKVYITFNNTQNAEVLLKELIKRDPSWAVFTIALAHVYTQKGDYTEAILWTDKTIEMEKYNPEAHLLKQSLKLHNQGNKLDPASYYVSLRGEAEPLLTRCLSHAEFPFVNEVLRHIAFIEAKITAANSLCL